MVGDSSAGLKSAVPEVTGRQRVCV